MLDQIFSCSVIGTHDDVARMLRSLVARTGANEVIIGGQMFGHAARRHSFSIAAEAMQAVAKAAA
jgi:alkanesulfonate monooxygenase SsuD/methylene tetrahydromethanopterin reductase-like flavin-dependent oxidoreductase (luciferase family)